MPERRYRFGFLGFGKVGAAFAEQLVRGGCLRPRVYDAALGQEEWRLLLEERAARTGVEICHSVADVVASSDLVFSVVTPKAAEEVAAEAAPLFSQGGFFVDCNSITPEVKERCAWLFKPSVYIDGAILGSVDREQAKAPIVLSGGRSVEVSRILNSRGFQTRAVGDQVGQASAMKMCRSIFMKGLECLFVELLLAAEKFGVTEPVLGSIEGSLAKEPFRDLMEMLVTTHAVHCARRSEEMEQVATALQAQGVPPIMTNASRERLLLSSRMGLSEAVGGATPQASSLVISALEKLGGQARKGSGVVAAG